MFDWKKKKKITLTQVVAWNAICQYVFMILAIFEDCDLEELQFANRQSTHLADHTFARFSHFVPCTHAGSRSRHRMLYADTMKRVREGKSVRVSYNIALGHNAGAAVYESFSKGCRNQNAKHVTTKSVGRWFGLSRTWFGSGHNYATQMKLL